MLTFMYLRGKPSVVFTWGDKNTQSLSSIMTVVKFSIEHYAYVRYCMIDLVELSEWKSSRSSYSSVLRCVMCGQERRVPGAMSPCWHGPLDLARLTCLIWLLVCIVRDVPCISDPTYELGIGQVVRISLPREETSRKGPNSSLHQTWASGLLVLYITCFTCYECESQTIDLHEVHRQLP